MEKRAGWRAAQPPLASSGRPWDRTRAALVATMAMSMSARLSNWPVTRHFRHSRATNGLHSCVTPTLWPQRWDVSLSIVHTTKGPHKNSYERWCDVKMLKLDVISIRNYLYLLSLGSSFIILNPNFLRVQFKCLLYWAKTLCGCSGFGFKYPSRQTSIQSRGASDSHHVQCSHQLVDWVAFEAVCSGWIYLM